MFLFDDWQFIETQNDLDNLNSRFYWCEGAIGIEFAGCLKAEDYFPKDVAYSGMTNVNVHLLVELQELRYENDPPFIEFVMIDCDRADLTFLTRPHFDGRVDTLKRITIEDQVMRCSRLIYRLVYKEYNLRQFSYFKQADSIC